MRKGELNMRKGRRVVSIIYMVVALLPCTSGCAEMERQAREAEQQRQEYINRRAAVLVPGTSQDEFMSVWGSPDSTRHYASATASIDQLQYGRCAASPGITTGVIFIMFI